MATKVEQGDVLVQRARRGDPAAFVEVARRWWPAVYRFAWNMLGTEAEAAAAARAVFVLALRFPGGAPGGAPFRTSLYAIALDFMRSRRRPAGEAAGVQAPQAGDGEDWPGAADAWARQPGAAAQVRRLLGRLDATDRAAFVLREIEELPIEEVAVILGVPPDDARARVHRATLSMSHLLGRLARQGPATCTPSPRLTHPCGAPRGRPARSG